MPQSALQELDRYAISRGIDKVVEALNRIATAQERIAKVAEAMAPTTVKSGDVRLSGVPLTNSTDLEPIHRMFQD